MNQFFLAVLLSMSPFFELRLGIPVAIAAGVSPIVAYVVCVFANILVVPILFFFLEVVHYRLLHSHRYRSAFDLYMERTRVKAHHFIEKYGMVGLALIVAIPFPGTGAYTGTLIAWFLGMNKWNAFLAIVSGILVAGAIVLGVSVGGLHLFGLF